MKIGWLSNAPWARTGYGGQTRIFVPRIQALGHSVTIFANYGLDAGSLDLGKTKVLPRGISPAGADIMEAHAKSIGADIVISLYDVWPFPPEATWNVKWCPWLPVDHDPIPPGVVQALATAWQPIAYSRFGVAQLKAAGFDPRYVPHGIETNVFKPKPRDEARRALGWPEDAFIIAWVAANKGFPPRKAWAEGLCAVRRFVDSRPNTRLYIHTQMQPTLDGIPIQEVLQSLDYPDDVIMACDPYKELLGFPDSFMVNVYNAADVLLNPSRGEGFGLPIVEAQACGTPVIVGDWTSMPELCFAGWRVQGQRDWSRQNSWQFVPFIADIEAALETAYQNRGSQILREQAREGALEYDADTVAREYWQPVLRELEGRL